MVTRDSFANTLSQYDDFRAGALFKPDTLAPFDFTVHDFDVTFIRQGREAGHGPQVRRRPDLPGRRRRRPPATSGSRSTTR